MSNQIETLIPRIVSRGLLGLRQQAILPRLVNSDLSAETARKGDVIDVPMAQPITVSDVEPGATMPPMDDSVIQSVPVRLNHWKKASFYLTDQEMAHIEQSEQFMPLQMHEAIRALVAAVHQSILDVCHRSKHLIGHPDFLPFQPYTSGTRKIYHELETVIEARRILNAESAPKQGRFGVLNFDAEASALALPQFYQAQQSGASTVPMEGEIGRKFGIDWYSSDLVPIAGKGAVSTIFGASKSAGTTKIDVSSAAETIHPGQTFRFATDYDQHYTVTHAEHTSSSKQTLTISPALVKNFPNNSTMTWIFEKPLSVVMHRDAIALAMRPLTDSGLEITNNSQMMSVTDPETGLSLRLEVSRQYKRTVWEFDLLWGVELIRPEFLVRIFS